MPIRTITVHVRQAHIDTARARNSHHCMIADGIKEACPEARHIIVDAQAIQFSNPVEGLRYKYYTPLVAQRAIIDWDAGSPVKPFKLVLQAETGRTRPMGWRATHATSPERKHVKKKRTTPIKKRGRLSPERKFGLRVLQE